jgi:hypothetical protein
VVGTVSRRGLWLNTRETVATDTRARRGTSLMVTIRAL